jgi:hypothetical protein
MPARKKKLQDILKLSVNSAKIKAYQERRVERVKASLAEIAGLFLQSIGAACVLMLIFWAALP